MANGIEGTQIPEICETKEDKLYTIGQLKYHYRQIAKQSFQGKTFINKNRPEIESASLFESACKVNGKYFRVIITIRKGVDNIAKFRYYTLKNIRLLPV